MGYTFGRIEKNTSAGGDNEYWWWKWIHGEKDFLLEPNKGGTLSELRQFIRCMRTTYIFPILALQCKKVLTNEKT